MQKAWLAGYQDLGDPESAAPDLTMGRVYAKKRELTRLGKTAVLYVGSATGVVLYWMEVGESLNLWYMDEDQGLMQAQTLMPALGVQAAPLGDAPLMVSRQRA